MDLDYPKVSLLMVFIIITRDLAHCLMSYSAIVATPTPSHLAITTCQYTCDRIKCCMCVFFVQIHPSICFSSYEAVCRLVAQNSNHRKSVILYLVITLSVNVSPETQFHPIWVKVINNLLIKSFSQQSPNSGENTRTKSILWRTSWEMAQTVSEFLVHSRISGSVCLVPKFSKTSYHERSHV